MVPSLDALSPAHRSVAGRVSAAVGAQPSDWSAHPALLVAAGEMDATVQFGGAVWDHAALSLIVEEAGGVAAGLDGGGHPITGTACFACDPATWRTVRAAAASPRR